MNITQRNEKVHAALVKVASPALWQEIEHYLSIDDDENRPRDYYDALDQAHDLAEDLRDRKVYVPCRRALVALNVFVVITDEQIHNTITLGGSRVKCYDFKLDGLKYVFDKHITLTVYPND